MSYKFESNAKSVIGELKDKLSNLIDEKVMRTAALTTTAIIINRVQQKGQNADGSQRKSKSAKTTGAYSSGYAKRRRKRGRQIAIVDLTDTGTTLRAFNVLETSPTSAAVGFTSETAAQIAEYNEAYYGKIFELSDAEQNKVIDGAIEEITRKLQ